MDYLGASNVITRSLEEGGRRVRTRERERVEVARMLALKKGLYSKECG